MKLTRPETVFLDHIRQYGSPRGLTLGRGRPNDKRTIASLITKGAIVAKPGQNGQELLLNYTVSNQV